MKFLPIVILFILLLFPLITQAQAIAQFQSVIRNIGNFLMGVGAALAVLVVVIGGLFYITAGGSEEQTTKAKKIITNGLVGAAILMAAGWIIAAVIELMQPMTS